MTGKSSGSKPLGNEALYGRIPKNKASQFRPIGGLGKKKENLENKPTYTFKEMMEEMVDHWLEYFSKK